MIIDIGILKGCYLNNTDNNTELLRFIIVQVNLIIIYCIAC